MAKFFHNFHRKRPISFGPNINISSTGGKMIANDDDPNAPSNETIAPRDGTDIAIIAKYGSKLILILICLHLPFAICQLK